MKARILFMLRLLLTVAIFCATFSNAETVHVKSNFSQKEIVALQTGDAITPNHELFEYYLYSSFEDVPYLQIVPVFEESSKGKKIEKFVPNFQAMEVKGHNYMIYYTLETSSSVNIISYVIFDGLYQNALVSGTYQTADSIQKIAANVANEAYFAITGEFGFFIGKLFYTERSFTTGYQVLYSHATTKTPYTSSDTMITSPSYCKNGSTVFFASRNSDEMNIYEMSTRTGRGKMVNIPTASTPYLLAPETSSDCSKLFISSLHDNGSQILMYNFRSRQATEIISDSNINTSPVFDETTNQIYYISNKILPTKIWTAFLNNPTEKYLVSRGLGGYIYLSLAPNKTKIAFVKILNSKFYLGIMDKDGANEILLKTGYIIEEPSWAPYGNNIIVAIQDEKRGPRTIYSISTKTGYSYPLKIAKGNIVQANWIIHDEDIISQPHYHK